VKILVVDDHVLIRDATRGVLREVDESALIYEARSAREAEDLIAENPDISLVLLDLNLPDRDGLAMLADLRRDHPAIAVIMLSAFSDRENVLKSLDTGAQGFIAKTSTRDVMVGAIKLVLAGGIYIPPEVLARSPEPSAAPISIVSEQARPTPADLGLTGRQLDVLALIMQGKSNKLICRQLDLAEPTVKNHVSAILKALKVNNRTEAVVAVTALGWSLPTPNK
jgi:DNA-binding NarL/FixJ family response regulator